MTVLSEKSQSVVDRLLNGRDPERREALSALSDLPDKQAVAAFLTARLSEEEHEGTRSWIISALAALNQPGSAAVVASHIDPDVEDFYWARYFALIGLARMQPPDLEQRLRQSAQKDPDDLVRLEAMRLLIENGVEDGYVAELLAALEDARWSRRWAACKVLRKQAGHRPLPAWVESRLAPVLETRLRDDRELADVRYQAALALGNMQHRTRQSVETLGRVLQDPLPGWVHRACLDALVQIAQPEVKDVLLVALEDEDAEIRVRAARGLVAALGQQEAIRFIVEAILRREDPPPRYFDALREIGAEAAAGVLADNLLHPDPTIAERASRALALLGGEQAMRTLQAQRTKALDIYTQLLGDADRQVMAQFNTLMGRAHQAFRLSMWMHGTVFAVGVGALIVGLAVALWTGFETFERFVGVGTAAGGLGTLLLLFYKNPLDNIRHSVTDLIRVNVVFLGYVRQINQIDATFKQMFLASVGFDMSEMKETVTQIRESVEKTLTEIQSYLKSA